MSTLGVGRRRVPSVKPERAVPPERPVFNHPRAWQAAGVVTLFACFFALGRATTSPSTSEFAAPAVLSAGAPEAGIPAALAGGAPLAPLERADVTAAWSAPPVARPAVHVRQRSAPQVAAVVVTSSPPPAPTGAYVAPRTVSAPQSASPPQSSAPTPSTQPSKPAPRPPTHTSQPPASGGSSFDSSG
jgi:hypothetical protein